MLLLSSSMNTHGPNMLWDGACYSLLVSSHDDHRLLGNFCLQKPDRDEWGSGLEALECALQLEKNVNQSLLDLHKVSTDRNDPHVSDCCGLDGYVNVIDTWTV